jgi:hypothetical protein
MTTLVVSGLYRDVVSGRAARGALTTTMWKISFAQTITRGRSLPGVASRKISLDRG